MAQNVYSLNVVGYVNVSVNTGFNMISNPLDDGAGNIMDNLIPTTADSSSVYKYSGGAYTTGNYIDGIGWDDSGTITLPPGQGFWFQAGSATNITFVGTVVQGTTTNSMSTGFNMLASVAPVAKQLGYAIADGDPSTNTWHFPVLDGDSAYTYTSGAYTTFNYIGGLGWDDMTGEGPNIGVGQGFWIQRSAVGAWVQTFTVQ